MAAASRYRLRQAAETSSGVGVALSCSSSTARYSVRAGGHDSEGASRSRLAENRLTVAAARARASGEDWRRTERLAGGASGKSVEGLIFRSSDNESVGLSL